MPGFILANAIKDGNEIAMPRESVFELRRIFGDIKAGKEGSVGFAFAQIRESVPHFHNVTTEIYFMANGEGKARVQDQTVRLGDYDVLKIFPGTVHSVESVNGLGLWVLSYPPWTAKDHILADAKRR